MPGFFLVMTANRADDIIAAIATPPGTGGVAIVRVSGIGTAGLLPKVFSAAGPYEHAKMMYGSVLSEDGPVDSGYAVMFYGPRSYTGEDTFELHVHGGAVSTGMVLRSVLDAGARMAEPGEFTRRAFLNGRMDLTQAQAVGDLIGAVSEAGASLALRQMKEALRRELSYMYDRAGDIAAHTEAVLEYPDEDIDEVQTRENAAELSEMSCRLAELAETYRAGRMIRDGLRVALAGAPNAGKSSLFNALCGDNVAIVTDVPGTTRDCLKETIQIRGAAVHLYDTAGLRDSADRIEKMGVDRAIDAAKDSDLILFVVDGSVPLEKSALEAWERLLDLDLPVLLAMNKSDLPQQVNLTDLSGSGAVQTVLVSAETGDGLTDLRDALYERTSAGALERESVLVSDLRQMEHLRAASARMGEAAELFEAEIDADMGCLALRSGMDEMGQVIGRRVDSDIIDRIFSKFCLGK